MRPNTMRFRLRCLALLPLAALAAACGDDPLRAGVFRLDGTWHGREFPYELSLSFDHDDDNRVTGGGELRGLAVRTSGAVADTVVSTRAEVSVEGQWDYPAYVLRLKGEGFHPVTMETRQAQRDTMNVVLRGSGFEGAQLRLVRQARSD
ncbi:MAG: hypothetical protein KY444_02555 [Gemmatimonadetes bacterium]|nr:hypothetical protein [Gemmatimonadota bacterium]